MIGTMTRALHKARDIAGMLAQCLQYSHIALLLSALCLSVSVYAQDAWQTPEFILQAFEEVVLKSEYSKGDQLVHKWEQPLRVWIAHHADQEKTHDWLATAHLEHLSLLTGLPVYRVDRAEDANLSIVFTKRQLWRNEIVLLSGNLKAKPPRGALCLFGIDLDSRKAIKRGWVVIPVDQAEEYRHLLACIVEEMTQVMGLPNDSNKVFPSVFNDNTPDSLLTGLDSLLVRLLYLPSIKSGMTAAQVRPIVMRALSQWQADGTIDHAERDVRQSELYELMGY